MALRIYGGSHSTQGYNSIDNSFNIGGGSASYTAGELGANVGDRIIPYSPARWSCQILTSQPKVTAYLNRDNSITITKIEAVNVTFVQSGRRPFVVRRARTDSSCGTKAGLSRRRVSAPTKIASHRARNRPTAAQSSGVEITNRCVDVSSKKPSEVVAKESVTRIVATLSR